MPENYAFPPQLFTLIIKLIFFILKLIYVNFALNYRNLSALTI